MSNKNVIKVILTALGLILLSQANLLRIAMETPSNNILLNQISFCLFIVGALLCFGSSLFYKPAD